MMHGWGIHLVGSERDLEEWIYTLPVEFDPHVQKIARTPETIYVLRDRRLDNLNSAREVRSLGYPLVEQLDGSIQVWRRTRRIRAAGVVGFDIDGKLHFTLHAEADLELDAVMLRAELSAGSTQPITPSNPQQWVDRASENSREGDRIADLLILFSRADNWYDLYKTIEVAESFPGFKSTMKNNGQLSRSNLVRRTANVHRHWRADRPSDMMTFRECVNFVGWMITTLLQQD